MRDEKGFDFKVLCVALGDAHQQHIERLDQVRPHRLVEIEHFFQTYKALEDKAVEVVGWRDHEAALAGPPRRPRRRGCAEREASAGEAPLSAEPARALRATRTPACRADASSSAVPLPEDAAEAVRAVVDEVRAEPLPDGARDVRWVRLDGLHLTLRFLGPTPESARADRQAAVEAVAAAAAGPIEIELGGAGHLPAGGRPRALWLGVSDGRRRARRAGARPRRGARRGGLASRRPPVPAAPHAGPIGRRRGGSRWSPAGWPRPWRIGGSRVRDRPARTVRERDRRRPGSLRARHDPELASAQRSGTSERVPSGRPGPALTGSTGVPTSP